MRALALAAALVGTTAFAQADPDPWFAPDKALHFGVSAGIAGAGYALTSVFTDSRPARLGVSAGLALSAGIGKELLDLAGGGDPSWKDLAWDALGTAVGVVLSWVLDVFVFTPLSQPPAAAPAGP